MSENPLNNEIPAEKIPKSIPESHAFEASFVETMDCGWDDMGYLENIKEGNREEATKILAEWFSQNIEMPFETWNALSPREKREVIFQWVETHQPTDWIDPTEPPLVPDFIGKDDRIPSTFLSDLHQAVAEELAEKINKANPTGEPLTEEDIIPSLEVFTSSSTPADTLLGTDLYFKFHYASSDESQVLRYLIDITKDPKRKEDKLKYAIDKADYILSFDLTDDEGRKKKLSSYEIAQKGKEIAHYLLKKIDSEQNSLRKVA